MCVIQVEYQCGGVGNAFRARCTCAAIKTVSAATPWCRQYECYECEARFKGVPTAEGAIYDGLPYDECELDADDHRSPFENRHHYTAADDATNIARAQTEYDHDLPDAAKYRRKKTVQLRKLAKQLTVPEKDLDKVAGLAFFWLDESRWTSSEGRGGCCRWNQETLPAASVLAAAADLHVPITLSVAEVASMIQAREEDLAANFNGCFEQVRRCWNDIGTYPSAEAFEDSPLHELAQTAASKVDEVEFQVELGRCFAERSLWWFSELRVETAHLPGDLRKILPEIATQRPYPGAHAGMWELHQPGAA